MSSIKLQKLEDIDAQIQVEHQAWLQEKGMGEKNAVTKGTPIFGFLGFTDSLYNKMPKFFSRKTLDETDIESNNPENKNISVYRMHVNYMEDRLSFFHKIGHYCRTVIDHGFNFEKIKEELRKEAEARIKIAEKLEEYKKFFETLRERFLLQSIQATLSKILPKDKSNINGNYEKLDDFFAKNLASTHLQTNKDYLEKYGEISLLVRNLIKKIDETSIINSDSDSAEQLTNLNDEQTEEQKLQQLEALTKRWLNLKIAKVKKTTSSEQVLNGVWGITNSSSIALGLAAVVFAVVGVHFPFLLPISWLLGNLSLGGYGCTAIEIYEMIRDRFIYQRAPTSRDFNVFVKDVLLFPVNAFGPQIFSAIGNAAKHVGKLFNAVSFVWNNVASNFIGVEDTLESMETGLDFVASGTNDFKLKNTSSATSFKHIQTALLNRNVNVKDTMTKIDDLKEKLSTSQNEQAINSSRNFAYVHMKPKEYSLVLKLNNEPAEQNLPNDTIGLLQKDKNLTAYWLDNGKIKSKSLEVDDDQGIKELLNDKLNKTSVDKGLINRITSRYGCANSMDLISKKSHHGQILNWDAGFFCLGGKSALAKLVYNAVAEYEALKPNEKKTTRLNALETIGRCCDYYLKTNEGDASKRRYSYVENLKVNVDAEIQNLKSHYPEKDSTLNLVGYKRK